MRSRVRRAVSRSPIPLAGLATAGLLAACGSSASAPAGSSATRAAPAVTHTVTRTATSTATTPSSTSRGAATSTSTTSDATASAGVPMCLAADLALVPLGGGGATGHELIVLGLRNSSAHACHTGGYPGVLFLGAGGAALPTTPDHTTHDFFGTTTLAELTIEPGGLASFRLGAVDVPSGDGAGGCEHVTGIQVIPPNDTATLRIARSLEECDGTVSVSPLQPGTTARP